MDRHFGLPKIVWYAEAYPEEAERIASWCHAADFLIGRLCGVWGVTDPTNALKTGYDPALGVWPSFITDGLAIPTTWLPHVIPSGSVVGQLREEVAEATGLPSTMAVTTGMTDGCASQIAAGAVQPGEWSTTIGTTLVIKGVTHLPILKPCRQAVQPPTSRGVVDAGWCKQYRRKLDRPRLRGAGPGSIGRPRAKRHPYALGVLSARR